MLLHLKIIFNNKIVVVLLIIYAVSWGNLVTLGVVLVEMVIPYGYSQIAPAIGIAINVIIAIPATTLYSVYYLPRPNQFRY